MKKIYNVLAVLLCLIVTSCYEEEALTPTEGGIELRFKVPQGNNSWDDDIAKIYDEFGVYLIYDDLDNSDFNRTWTGASIASYQGQSSLNDEMTESYVRFMKTHIFPYLKNKEVISKVLPMYWYLGYNVNAYMKLDLGFFVMEYHTPQSNLFDGLDFWSLCMYGEPDPTTGEEFFTPKTQKEYSQSRNMILGEIFTKAVEYGNIKIPAAFDEGLDYTTSLVNGIGKEEDENYFLNRGFPGTVNLARFKNINEPSSGLPPTSERNFIGYMTILMLYNQTEIQEEYPADKYPLVAEKLSFVYNYIKENYDLDLNEIAIGPDDWESLKVN